MTNTNQPAGKAGKIIYWVATVWLSLGMLATAFVQLAKGKGQGGIDMLQSLGYPDYLLQLLGASKILAVLVLLLPKFPLLKEWAYAGLCFMMCGAMFSHIAAGHPVVEVFPSLLLLVLTALSWYFRPPNRKLYFIHS